jgi:hypothetical protein
MSYDSVRDRLRRSRQLLDEDDENTRPLTDALEQLAFAIEADLAQIKGAISHVAYLLERRGAD